jgi:hypothetical protein
VYLDEATGAWLAAGRGSAARNLKLELVDRIARLELDK